MASTGQVNKIDGMDVVAWMRNHQRLQSSFATPPKRLWYLGHHFTLSDESEEEHF